MEHRRFWNRSGFLSTHKEKQMVASTIFERSSSGQKLVSIFDQKKVVKLFSTMGFIFDHFFAPTICLRFQQLMRFFPRHQHLNKNFKFVAGSRFFHLIENANIMQIFWNKMTWFGFLATHKAKEMVASTIFENSSSGQKRVPIVDQQNRVKHFLTRQK